MRLHKRLVIDGDQVELISDNLTLELHSPGRAIFTVKASAPLNGLVQYSVGYKPDRIPVYLLGYVEQSQAIDAQQQRLVVRELPATLNRRLPLALRHCRATDLLAEINNQTGLHFMLGGKGEDVWQQTLLPRFDHRGGGYMALDALGAAFDLSRYIWQQQPDGRVYVGSWDDSPHAGKSVPVPINQLTRLSAANAASLPVVPNFRPGVQLRIAGGDPVIITRTNIIGTEMRIHWTKNPWDGRLKRDAA
ncbi:MAG: hypothetical protein V7707_08235 [Motiliproteus sp.]